MKRKFLVVVLGLGLVGASNTSAIDKSACLAGLAISTVQCFMLASSDAMKVEQNLPVQSGLTLLQAGLVYHWGSSYAGGALVGAAIGGLAGTWLGDILDYLF